MTDENGYLDVTITRNGDIYETNIQVENINILDCLEEIVVSIVDMVKNDLPREKVEEDVEEAVGRALRRTYRKGESDD